MVEEGHLKITLYPQVMGEKFSLLSKIVLGRLEGVARVIEAVACIQPQVEEPKPEHQVFYIQCYCKTDLRITEGNIEFDMSSEIIFRRKLSVCILKLECRNQN